MSNQTELFEDEDAVVEDQTIPAYIPPAKAISRQPRTLQSAPPVQQQPRTLEEIIVAAAMGGMDLDKVERLFALKERVEIREAEKEWNKAFSAFKAECPVIKETGIQWEKNRGPDSGDPKIRFTYATLDDMAPADAVLARHGLSINYKALENVGENGVVTSIKGIAILRHRDGHKEETDFTAPVNYGGYESKEKLIAAAKTYAIRNATMMALGIKSEFTSPEQQENNAGKAKPTSPAAEKIPAEQVAEYRKQLIEVGVITVDHETGEEKADPVFVNWMYTKYRAKSLKDLPVAAISPLENSIANRRKTQQKPAQTKKPAESAPAPAESKKAEQPKAQREAPADIPIPEALPPIFHASYRKVVDAFKNDGPDEAAEVFMEESLGSDDFMRTLHAFVEDYLPKGFEPYANYAK